MTPAEIQAVRADLKLTQAQLAQLLGVHVLTISKWERGALSPTPHQAAMLRSFGTAAEKEPDIGAIVVGLLVGAGVAMAVYKLLEAAFKKPKARS